MQYISCSMIKEEQLKQVGITHIIMIRGSNESYYIRPHFPEHINYLILEIADKPTENIIKYFQKVLLFLWITFYLFFNL